MGIPKFYRWLSERYPLINQPGGATVVPIIDNFYLDMNGIIHNCTHGNNPDVRLTEDEMIVRIFAYLDKLFHIVKPQKLIFMAIDGVAPRAKMNQQRARRFKSAREAEEAAAAAAAAADPPPDPAHRFDSNCITPGTPFMARLGAHLRFFIRKKIAEDPAWQVPTVVFSGHEVPGEGEHKIMEYIRWAKRAPGYAPNTRHCLYGLDADLVMLSLVTHEPHFCLLREVVSYGAGGRGQPAREVLENPCQEHFVLLQIGLLRDYLDVEFRGIAGSLPFDYDLERVVDDFVLFCMLVGNDFLPPLPTVDIAEGSLDSMFALYRRLLPTLGGYLTHAGDLHRGRLEVFLGALAADEADVLAARAQDTEEFEAKRSARAERDGRAPAWAAAAPAAAPAATELDEDDAFALEMARMALRAEGHELELLAAAEGEGGAAAPSAAPAAPTMMSREARDLFLNGDKESGLAAWRQRWYRDKLGVGDSQRRAVVEAYIQGLHWVLEYYYRGVASWNWYYPFHYAPMASDFTALGAIAVTFSPGAPFLPFEQLLAVQPASSCRLLPEPYRWLMTDPNSPIADFYPVDFEVDCEGKRAEWEGVVLIPFIDEARLLAASRSVPPGVLAAEERARNALGDIMVFAHAPGSTEASFCASTLPAHFASVGASNSTALVQPAPPPLPPGEKGFVPAFVAGTRVGATGPPGFPTLRTLGVTGELRRAGINVFGTTSRKESLILRLKDLPGGAAPTAGQVAGVVVGQRTWVKWPFLQEALVVAVSDGRSRATGAAPAAARPLTPAEAGDWERVASQTASDYLVKQGLELGPLRLLLHVRPCEGLVRQIDGTVEKRFGKGEVAYPLQITLRRNPAPDPRFQPDAAGAGAGGDSALRAGDRVVFLGRAHYGCLATVLPGGPRGLSRKGQALAGAAAGGGDPAGPPYRIEVEPAPANAAQAAQAARRILGNVNVAYQPSGQVARRLGVSSRALGRMTGNVWVQTGEERRDRVDVGFCVKHGGKGLYVPDYCAPLEAPPSAPGAEPRKGGWAYSDALVRILEQHKARFAWLWAAVDRQEAASGPGSGPPQALTLDDLFPGTDPAAAASQVAALRQWLKGTPLGRRPLVTPTARVAPEAAVRMLQAALPPRPKALPPAELENVAPALLLPPLVRGGTASAFAGGTFELGDRVAAVGAAGGPAFGARGTVVGVYDGDAVEVLFDAEFIGGTDLYGRCNGDCGAMLPADQLLNLSRTHAVKAEGAAAPRMVRRVGGAAAAAGGAAANGGAGAGMSAAEALAAASAALQGKAPEKQPRIPDKAGSKGFALGRGRGVAPPAAAPPPRAAPGAPAAPPNAGAQLLAHLHRSASSASAPGAPQGPPPPMPQPPPMPMAMAMPPPPGLMPGPPGGFFPMPPPPPHPGMYGGPPPPPGTAQGNALLAQLQRGGAPPPGGPPPPPPPNPGSALLSQLKGAAVPASPALAPSPSPPSPNAGSLLLAQLQRSPAAVAAAPAAPAPPQGGSGGGGLDVMWQRMQQQAGTPAAPAPPAAPAAPAAPAPPSPGPPPPPSAAMLAGVSSGAAPSADALWQLMGGAGKK